MGEETLHRAVICIGSNAADRELRLDEAEGFLNILLKGCRFSQTLDSNDTSGRTNLRYSNRLCAGYFEADYDELDLLLKHYEFDRRRKNDKGVVEIDLDVVVFDGEVKRPGTYMAPYFQYLYSDFM